DLAPTPAADAGVTGYDFRPLHHHHTAPRNERLQQSGTPHPGGALIELENNGQISGEQRANVGRWPLGGRSCQYALMLVDFPIGQEALALIESTPLAGRAEDDRAALRPPQQFLHEQAANTLMLHG